MSRYECDQCGACCKGNLIVEAYDIDLLREPKLVVVGGKAPDDDHAVRELMHEFEDDVGRCLIVACGKNKPCPFLNPEDKCSIYPTRPNACVAMEAGDEQCQKARKQEGLPPLQPIPDTNDVDSQLNNTCNDWSSNETQLLHDCLSSEATYDHCLGMACESMALAPVCSEVKEGIWSGEEACKFLLGNALKEYVESKIPTSVIAGINWYEVADQFLEEARSVSSYDEDDNPVDGTDHQ